MNRNILQSVKNVLVLVAILFFIMSTAHAVSSSTTTTTKPDGTTVVVEEKTVVTRSNSGLGIAVIGVAVLGGIIISILGILTILKAMNMGAAPHQSSLDLDAKNGSLKLKKISQGVIISLFGAALCLFSIKEIKEVLSSGSIGGFSEKSARPISNASEVASSVAEEKDELTK